MQINHIQAAIDTYRCTPGSDEADRIGCTEEEIAALEAHIRGGYRLPAAYLEFLLYAGRGWGDVFGARNISYRTAWVPAAYPHRSWPRDFLPGAENPRFPDNVFLIEDYLGDYFSFIKLDEGDDPPVYFWSSEFEYKLEAATLAAPSFSVYLNMIVSYARLYVLSSMARAWRDNIGYKRQWGQLPPAFEIPEPAPGIEPAIDTLRGIPGLALTPRMGSTSAEIDALEALIGDGRRLPAAYRAFLAYAGQQWGEVGFSSSLTYRVALDYAQDPDAFWPKPYLMAFASKSTYPARYFMIEIQSDYFAYLDYDGNDDPMVSTIQRDDSTRGYSRVNHPNFAVYLHWLAGMEKLKHDRLQKEAPIP